MTQLQLARSFYRNMVMIVLLCLMLSVALFVDPFHWFHTTAPSSSTSLSISTTTPTAIIDKYYQDIIAQQYLEAYRLLSFTVRQHIDAQGGSSYLAAELQQLSTHYGPITSHTIIQSTTDRTTNQTILRVQIQRAGLKKSQQEVDTYHLIWQNNTWAIDQWITNIVTK